MKLRVLFSGGTAAVLLFTGYAVNPVTGKKEVILVSEDQEKTMGAQSDPRPWSL